MTSDPETSEREQERAPVRPARPEDAEAVARLGRQLGYALSTGQAAERLRALAARDDQCVLVADEEGKVRGWLHALAAPRLLSEACAEIVGLVVDADARGRGLGRALVEAADHWREARGLAGLRLRSNVTRAEARRFFARLGFRATKDQTVFVRPAAVPSAPDDAPALYGELADRWPLVSAPADYAEEALLYERLLREACDGAPETLLELGSGGGNNAFHLKAGLRLTLVDRAPGMLAVSRVLNPECEHVEGDLRSVRLGRAFDLVFVHDAASYLTDPDDVRAAIATAWLHCRPGGAALFAPDHLRGRFRPGTDHGGHDATAGGEGVRYLEWTWDPDPDDDTYLVDYAFLLRAEDGRTRVVRDRHVCGLFSRGQWLGWLAEAGFEARTAPFVHSGFAPGDHELFVARRPAGS